MYAGQGYVALTTYLHPTVLRSMAEQIQQQVALHCFTNLVEFLNIHKFETDLASSLWRKLFLNICLSSIDHMNVKKFDLSAMFNLDRRTISEYMNVLTVHEIKFPQPKLKQGPSWDKREVGHNLLICAKVTGLTISPPAPRRMMLLSSTCIVRGCIYWLNQWPQRISMQPW